MLVLKNSFIKGEPMAVKPTNLKDKIKQKAKLKVAAVEKTRPAKKTAKTKTEKKLSPRAQKIQAIRKLLVRQREALLSEAEEALNSLPGQAALPDVGDQASAEADTSFMFQLREREQKLLKKIDAALEMIDTGVFGICEDCGQEIDIKRLEARPVTTMCIICKTEQEEEEKQKRN